MGKCKNAYLAKLEADRFIKEYLIRRYTRQQMLDFATVALGRLGWGEKRLTEFEATLSEVYTEYAELMVADNRDDKELVYSKECLDRELRIYCGSKFVPYDVRYGTEDIEK